MRGTTIYLTHKHLGAIISTHAPRVGGDISKITDFFINVISIHAPHAGGDVPHPRPVGCCRYFNPRPRVGGDEQTAKDTDSAAEISIHAPMRGATVGEFFLIASK